MKKMLIYLTIEPDFSHQHIFCKQYLFSSVEENKHGNQSNEIKDIKTFAQPPLRLDLAHFLLPLGCLLFGFLHGR